MAYKMTPARRAAIKRAQAASARKRRGTGKGKLAAANRKNSPSRKKQAFKYAAYYGGLAAIAYASHRHNKKVKSDIRRIKARSNVEIRKILR